MKMALHALYHLTTLLIFWLVCQLLFQRKIPGGNYSMRQKQECFRPPPYTLLPICLRTCNVPTFTEL